MELKKALGMGAVIAVMAAASASAYNFANYLRPCDGERPTRSSARPGPKTHQSSRSARTSSFRDHTPSGSLRRPVWLRSRTPCARRGQEGRRTPLAAAPPSAPQAWRSRTEQPRRSGREYVAPGPGLSAYRRDGPFFRFAERGALGPAAAQSAAQAAHRPAGGSWTAAQMSAAAAAARPANRSAASSLESRVHKAEAVRRRDAPPAAAAAARPADRSAESSLEPPAYRAEAAAEGGRDAHLAMAAAARPAAHPVDSSREPRAHRAEAAGKGRRDAHPAAAAVPNLEPHGINCWVAAARRLRPVGFR